MVRKESTIFVETKHKRPTGQTLTAMQKLSKKVATATSVAQVSLTAVLDAVVFDNGATGADLMSSSSALSKSKLEVFNESLKQSRLALEFKRKFNCPLGELREQLDEAFGDEQVTWGMACKDRGFSGKTAKDAGNHAGKVIRIAESEEAYATANKMTLMAVQAKFHKQHPTNTSTRAYGKWCNGESLKKDSKAAVAFTTLTCEESGAKWIGKMLDRVADPKNDLSMEELERVMAMMAAKMEMAKLEKEVAAELAA